MPLSPYIQTHTQQAKLSNALCLFMCRTYFEIIVYKYFAIGCCKLCRIVCLLGHILLSYIVYASIFNCGHIHFFTILKFLFLYFCLPFVPFVYCSMLFPFYLAFFLSSSVFISLHRLLHPPPQHAFVSPISPLVHISQISLYLSSSLLVFYIVCYNNTNKKEIRCACDRCEQSLEPYDYKLSGAANH